MLIALMTFVIRFVLLLCVGFMTNVMLKMRLKLWMVVCLTVEN